ncbi:hypothetical protein BCR43DRAFT_499447 [Syncephalastrum racemosum]|uniref:NodB homology domain-containing protein n=1 Tax=Syncephalastrum racemosum TaxID=13706 RepID=A0A1X2H0E2_SYNRA|nr:hypothetical protein BCR43DRAFT_499447 [Syncephalastrum racemosum]
MFLSLKKIALLLTAVAHAQAQQQPQQPAASASTSGASALQTPTSQFEWKQAYPVAGNVPQPKSEWLKLIDNSTIPTAPLSQAGPTGELVNTQQPGQDPYCHWTFTQCRRPKDIYTCQPGHWGLSFDDGPTADSPPLYDFLKKHDIKATFFLIGGQVIQFPEHVKRLHQEGHEIAIHTWSHTLLTTQTNEQIIAELKWTEQAIKEVIGVSPRLVRPPFGDMDDRVRNITEKLGFIPAIWDHDTNDWKIGTPGFDAKSIETTIKEWVAKNNTNVGGISLQHDRVKETVDAAVTNLPLLIDAYKAGSVGQCANMSSNQLYKETLDKGTEAKGDPSGAERILPSAFTCFLALVLGLLAL